MYKNRFQDKDDRYYLYAPTDEYLDIEDSKEEEQSDQDDDLDN